MKQADENWFILLAAGKGSRMAEAAGCPKQVITVGSVPLYWLSVRTAARSGRIKGIVLVFPEGTFAESREQAEKLLAGEPLPLELRFAKGGPRRQDSVFNGLLAVPADCRHVLVHDAARPFFTAALADRLLDAIEKGSCAAIPGIAVTDTIKRTDKEGRVTETPPRAELKAVQTPQAFDFKALYNAHARNKKEHDYDVTDDAQIMEQDGKTVVIIDGEERNMKITHPADLERLQGQGTIPVPCTGFGYDVHRYGGTRPLVLASVAIPCEYTVEAHSDGDVVLHALMDALLSLAGLGDIGMLFPDTDPAFDGADSAKLLDVVLQRIREKEIRLTHADVTVVAQKPKISPYKEAMRERLCALLGLPASHVNVKATTEEKLGFTGALQGIKAYAVVSGVSAERV